MTAIAPLLFAVTLAVAAGAAVVTPVAAQGFAAQGFAAPAAHAQTAAVR